MAQSTIELSTLPPSTSSLQVDQATVLVLGVLVGPEVAEVVGFVEVLDDGSVVVDVALAPAGRTTGAPVSTLVAHPVAKRPTMATANQLWR